jgi:6-pyruvoyltetrahydropterin/6-carboxytetrahydropterin synthase
MKVLADLIKSEVEEYMDHKNLNVQVAEFKTLNPTAEHIAYVIWNRLRVKLNTSFDLKVTLYETPRNFVEYCGE